MAGKLDQFPLSRYVAGVKSTNATINARVHEVAQLLSQGAARWRVLRYAAEQGWGLSDRTLDNYIQRATKLIAAQYEQEREQFVAVQLASLDDLADRATQDRQYSAAVGARCAILRVIGADTPRN